MTPVAEKTKLFGLAGWSGSGKTTVMVRLLPELIGRGYRVSTIKHAHHNFDVDQPGKDSHRHRVAGATEVMVSSGNRWALMHELRGAPEFQVPDLLAQMAPVDLVLIEGFKRAPYPKLEIYRPHVGKPLLAPDDPNIVAVATDDAEGLALDGRPCLPIDGYSQMADFIEGYLDLKQHATRRV